MFTDNMDESIRFFTKTLKDFRSHSYRIAAANMYRSYLYIFRALCNFSGITYTQGSTLQDLRQTLCDKLILCNILETIDVESISRWRGLFCDPKFSDEDIKYIRIAIDDYSRIVGIIITMYVDD